MTHQVSLVNYSDRGAFYGSPPYVSVSVSLSALSRTSRRDSWVCLQPKQGAGAHACSHAIALYRLCPPLSWLCLAIISVPPVGHDTVGWAGCVQWDGMGKREARHMRRLTENRENHVKINHKLVSDPTGLSSRSPSIHLMIRVIIRDYHF